MTHSPTAADAVALLRGDGDTYMANADVGLVRRVGAVAYSLTALATLAVLPFVPPTALLGPAAGWAIAVAFVGCGLAAACWTVRAPKIDLRVVYRIDAVLLIGIGLIGWLAQDGDLYSTLPLLVLVFVAAVFPPRPVAVALALAVAAQVPALLAIGADTDSVVELALHAFTWLCLSGLALMWTAGVRVQRHALHAHARVDALTGLGNRRAFDESLAAELSRAVRAGRPLSLIVGDLDGFKAINDRHGHLAGDVCLREVAEVVRNLTRQPDTCFRWGGDEFVVLLPEADGERARAVAERVSDAVREACRAPDGRPLSLTFGVAEHEDGQPDPAALLASADANLMAAKVG
jgi:diguanylate cyclase (GGDEF)-like protein